MNNKYVAELNDNLARGARSYELQATSSCALST